MQALQAAYREAVRLFLAESDSDVDQIAKHTGQPPAVVSSWLEVRRLLLTQHTTLLILASWPESGL